MAENTTDAAALVVGQPDRQPSLRRLARACIALARWQRSHTTPAADADRPPTDPPEVRS